MSDNLQTVQKKYDVFLVYTESDEIIASHVEEHLKKTGKRVISQLDPKAFPPGEPIIGNVHNHVENSKITLIILTDDSYSNKWICLETILSAEKSKRDGVLGLRVIQKDLTQQQIDGLKMGLLEKVPYMKFDMNHNWEEHLSKFVTDELRVGDLLPVGCLAHGQIFSHFTGFLRHVLPDLKERIMREAHGINLDLSKVSTKYFILLPSSCKIQDSLVTTGRSQFAIRHIHIIELKKIHVGKVREYKLSLYSVSNGKETYYFVADYPNVLNAIYELKEKDLAEVDLKYQIARFYFTLHELMNHSQNIEFNDTVEIVTYNDNIQELARVLFDEVRRSVNDTDVGALQRSTLRLLSVEEKRKYDAYISCADDTESLRVAESVEAFLKAHNKTVAREAPNIPPLRQLEFGDWTIFIISKDFLEQSKKTFECESMLACCINQNNMRILPVVCDGVDVAKLPKYMKFITFVSTREPNFLENICQKMNGESVRMCEKIPCGDVATGLAWAYVINYLVLTLLTEVELTDRTFQGFEGRIRDFLLKNQISVGCIAKLFILVPQSCFVPDKLEDEANKGEDKSVRSIELLGTLEQVIVNSGGQHKRTYYLYMYRYTNTKTGKSVCFIGEYATPSRCLYDMAHDYPFAGLEKHDMYIQAEDFVKKTREIINRQAVKQKKGDISSLVDLVHFDDSKTSLMDAIEQKIEHEQHYIVYTQDVRPQGDPNYPLPSFVPQ